MKRYATLAMATPAFGTEIVRLSDSRVSAPRSLPSQITESIPIKQQMQPSANAQRFVQSCPDA